MNDVNDVNDLHDDELLERLGGALRHDLAPTDAEVAGFHDALRAARLAPSAGRRASWRRRGAIVGLVAAVSVPGVAAATDTWPDPVRDLVHDLGLPVDSSALRRVEGAIRQIDASISADDAAGVEAAMQRLTAAFGGLDDDEARGIADRVAAAQRRAERYLRSLTVPEPAAPTPTPTSGPGSTTSTTRSAIPPVPTPATGDDGNDSDDTDRGDDDRDEDDGAAGTDDGSGGEDLDDGADDQPAPDAAPAPSDDPDDAGDDDADVGSDDGDG